MALRSYARGCTDKISRNFSVDEFECNCGHCSYTFIDDGLVSGLQTLRDKMGAAVVITSGYRCEYKQNQLKEQGYQTASGISTHTQGMAADIRCDERSGADLQIFAKESGFMAIGVAPSWIHVDTRADKVRNWTYTK